jgi:hypothetical protein
MAVIPEEKLEALLKGAKFTEKQEAFLRAKAQGTSDIDACTMAGVSRMSATRWKAKPAFAEVYDYIQTQAELPVDLSAEQRQELLQHQTNALSTYLPQVVAENIRIALNGHKEQDRLKAIEMVYKAVGLNPDNLNPMDKLNDTAKAITAWAAPVLAAYRQGMREGSGSIEIVPEEGDEDEIVEGEFTRVDGDKRQAEKS